MVTTPAPKVCAWSTTKGRVPPCVAAENFRRVRMRLSGPPAWKPSASSFNPPASSLPHAAAELECQDPSSFSSRQSSSCQGKGNGKYWKNLELKTCPECNYRGNKMAFWKCWSCKKLFRDMTVREEKDQLLAASLPPSASSVQHPADGEHPAVLPQPPFLPDRRSAEQPLPPWRQCHEAGPH